MSSPAAESSKKRPLLALDDVVLFPGDVATIEVRGRGNLLALDRATGSAGICVACPLRTPGRAEPEPEDLHEVGTLARIVSRRRLPEGAARIVLQGIRRVRLAGVDRDDTGAWIATLRPLPIEERPGDGKRELTRMLVRLRTIAASNPTTRSEIEGLIPLYGEDPARITDLAAVALPLEYRERAMLLAEPDPLHRVALLNRLLSEEVVRVRTGEAVEDEVARRIRHAYLTEKLAILRTELGEADPEVEEAETLARRIEECPLSAAARRHASLELEHFRRAAHDSAEFVRIRNHLEWMLELPWAEEASAGSPPTLARVTEHLEKSHVGLVDVKQRIAEFLAVRRLGGGARGTVLCFLGPPGTGKSSMGRAVAAALGRPYVAIPMGAKTQEHEIVGTPHRVAGGMPGAILSCLHRVGARNPVILLDEIDNLSLGAEGTSAGVLLHLLDPEQNGEFLDNYLGVPFDLSQCIFLAAANEAEDLPEGLLDRMEIIEFSGYSDSEKMEIARRHLLERARAQAGVSSRQFRISPAALRSLIRGYTEEAGVRDLQRRLISLARKAALAAVKEGPELSVKKGDLMDLLGPRIVDEDVQRRRAAVGVSTGLAWTSVGGALLPIESIAVPGAGRMILTGQLGEVLRESVQTAVTYVRTRFAEFGVSADALDSLDLHLHFPSAATPKDGPSAGIAIATALVSLLTRRPSRHDVAMTGEMSLLGRVLPVGGIREKLLAAIRNGIPEVIVPMRNAEEVMRLSTDIRRQLTIHLINDVGDAFELALVSQPRGVTTRHTSSPEAKRAAPRARKRGPGKRSTG